MTGTDGAGRRLRPAAPGGGRAAPDADSAGRTDPGTAERSDGAPPGGATTPAGTAAAGGTTPGASTAPTLGAAPTVSTTPGAAPTPGATPGDAPTPDATPGDATAPGDAPTPGAMPTPTGATSPPAPDVAPPVRLARTLLPLPSQAVRVAGRATARGGLTVRAWSRRASGRFVLAAVALLGLVAAATAAGAYAVPATAPPPAEAAPTATAQVQAPAPVPPVDPSVAPVPAPTAAPTPSGSAPARATRPASALAAWAGKLSGPLAIPVPALEAYGYAQLAMDQMAPACHLRWTTLAGIGKVESNHGSTGAAVLLPDGRVLPPVIGPVLDGTNGTLLVRDTDQGRYDGDRTYDRAIGPMQFLPATWARYGTDADGDGTADPNDIDDAALAAARYLCGADRDLAQPGDWWTAVLTYNAVSDYALRVFDTANGYGEASRNIT